MGRGMVRILGGAAVVTGVLILTYVVRSRRRPAACPYGQRLVLDLPRPFFTRTRLRQVLAPRPGERLLEIGPGTGYYTLAIAPCLVPGGTLDCLDIQREMLVLTRQRARARGLINLVALQGDAQALPYATGSFDAAYLVATLGEVPDNDVALHELHRVLKPGGRLIVGEGIPDPHMVSFRTLRSRAEAAGLRFDGRCGGRLGYLARFRRPS